MEEKDKIIVKWAQEDVEKANKMLNNNNNNNNNIHIYSTVVKVLCYKSKGRWFDSDRTMAH